MSVRSNFLRKLAELTLSFTDLECYRDYDELAALEGKPWILVVVPQPTISLKFIEIVVAKCSIGLIRLMCGSWADKITDCQ